MGGLPKKEGRLGQFANLRGELGKKEERLIPQCTLCTKLLESFTVSQSGQNNGVKIWVFDATRRISRCRKLPLILILKMK